MASLSIRVSGVKTKLINRKPRVVALYGDDSGMWWEHDVVTAISHIEAGLFQYYYLVNEKPVVVVVACDSSNDKYLKGEIDENEPTSLLNLEPWSI